jgi:DNA adenine methylase
LEASKANQVRDYIKSPMNYIGNKYRILPQIQRWFPKDINTMVDIFSGGCDVIINTMANKKRVQRTRFNYYEIVLSDVSLN